MTIPQASLRKCKRLRQRGDVGRLAEMAGISFVSMSKALNGKETNESVAKIILEFYSRRKEILETF